MFRVVRQFALIGEVAELGGPAGLHVIALLGGLRGLRYMMGGTMRILWQEGGILGIERKDGGHRGRMIYLHEEVLLIFVLVAQT